MNVFELQLQSTPRIYRVTSGDTPTATLYLQPINQKPFIATYVRCWHSGANALNTAIVFIDGIYTFTFWSGSQNGGVTNGISLFNDNTSSYPIVLLPSNTAGKKLRISYTVAGLNGEDEEAIIEAVIYELNSQANLP